MTEENTPLHGCGYFGFLSLTASFLGSTLAAVVLVAMKYSPETIGAGAEGAAHFFLATGFFFCLGFFIAVPVGFAVGIPLTALSRHYLAGHVVIATLAFAIVGLLGGLAIKHIIGDGGFDDAELVFGACVGGMHPLVHARAEGVPWPKAVAALLLSAAIMPSLAYAGEDASNLMESHAEFEILCGDRYGSMAFVADRTALERRGDPSESKGKWQNQRKWRSLYAREDRVPLDKAQILIARDYAYVPSGVAGWITGGRRVERHCLSEKRGSDADMLRDRGFGKRPGLQDLVD